jgi:hypothetical protein
VRCSPFPQYRALVISEWDIERRDKRFHLLTFDDTFIRNPRSLLTHLLFPS